jgi:K+/H+ antiporter YhaU regulatory subunit KhtT
MKKSLKKEPVKDLKLPSASVPVKESKSLKKKISVQKLVTSVDNELVNLHQSYKDLRKRFSVFVGKKLTQEESDAVVAILNDMAKVYKELQYIMRFVSERYTQCVEINNDFNAFTAQLKSSYIPR